MMKLLLLLLLVAVVVSDVGGEELSVGLDCMV